MKNNLRIFLISIFCLLVAGGGEVIAQNKKQVQKEDVYVDEERIMRWGHSDQPVKRFGVNQFWESGAVR